MVDIINNYMWEIWAVITVLCLIAEMLTGGFFIICFAIGGIASAIAALCGAGFYWQLFVFALISAISIFGVRPFALKYLHHGHEDSRPSNADALIGATGIVEEEITTTGFGYVAIDGDMWKSVSFDGHTIAKDTRVVVTGRNSIILTVKPE